jgi:hypothetical protein
MGLPLRTLLPFSTCGTEQTAASGSQLNITGSVVSLQRNVDVVSGNFDGVLARITQEVETRAAGFVFVPDAA